MHDAGRLKVNPQVLLTEMGDGTGVLLQLETKFYYTLNATSVALWRAVEAGRATSIAALAQELEAHFDVDAETAARDTAEVVGELLDEGLLSEHGLASR